MNWQSLRQPRSWLQQRLQTTHGRIMVLGLLVQLLYFPGWFWLLLKSVLSGYPNLMFNPSLLYLGFEMLWKDRVRLAEQAAAEEEELVGHAIVLGSVILFPFCWESISLQALLCMLIFIGISYSQWGLYIFKAHWLAMILVLASIYPNLLYLCNEVWRFVTPHNLLENCMAQAGVLILKAIGQPATAQGSIISLPSGAVEVAPGCSGFDMAYTLIGTSIIFGLFLKQHWLKIGFLSVFGAFLALVLNVPRIVLLTFASVYWGKASFEFWHGPIGGQLFSGVLITIFYYVMMGSANSEAPKPKV